MDKKKMFSMIFAGLVLIGAASAILVEYFGQRTTTIDVELPIQVTGNELSVIENGIGCEEVEGEDIAIKNIASMPLDIEITSTEDVDVVTSYVGTLELSKKAVDFGNEPWNLVDGPDTKAIVEYTVVGDTFSAEVISGAQEGYTLIYYKDKSDRFNSPAKGILVENVVGNLPYTNDKNADEYDYCTTGEYDTCHGAKIWYVPTDAKTGEGLDWTRADEFLFETVLIQYNDAGVITMYPGVDAILDIKPVFELDCMLEGEVNITTTIDLFEGV